MSTINIGTITISYDDVGVGLPLLLVHGHPFNRSMWQDQMQGLANRYRVIAPDLRGYGESTVISGKTLLSDFAHDLVRLLDALAIPEVVLGGLSMGGQIVLEFYRLYPQRVKALLLADTFAQADTAESYRKRYEMADRLVREGMHAYADEVLPKMVCNTTIRTQPAVAARVLDMMRTSHPEGAAAALRGRAERPDYSPLLARITVPTLIIVGREDAFTPISDAEYMHERIPNSQMVVVDDAGHLPNIERSAIVNQAVLAFLQIL